MAASSIQDPGDKSSLHDDQHVLGGDRSRKTHIIH